MPTNDMALKIKYLRHRNGLTLEDVANAVGVGKSTVRKWETGIIANMRRDKIAALADVLNTTPAYLMGWEDSAQATEQPTAPEWYDGLTEEQKQAVKLIAHLPEEQLNILLRVAEQMQLPRSQETE